MSDRWFQRCRQDWIEETLRVFGYINRKHLMIKFGMSTMQAALDLKRYRIAHPEVSYNASQKRFEVPDGKTGN